jgi:hypothetical protein
VEDDAALFAWLRHYGALILLFVVLGGSAGLLYTRVVPRRTQAWTLVVETGTRIGPRQLGSVSQALFHASEVYRPAMQRLGIDESPIRFFDRDVSLQPVPTTNTLIVIGTAPDLVRAERISSVTAISFVQALRVRGFGDFHIFGATQPAPVRAGVSTRVAMVVAAVGGLWLGLAVAIVHYRARRPVLSAAAAAALAGAGRVVELEGNRPLWLGVLRGHPTWKETGRNHIALDRFVATTGRAILVAPQMAVRRREDVASLLGYAAADGIGESERDREFSARWAEARRLSSEPLVLLSDPGTRQSDLAMIGALEEGGTGSVSRVDLLWIA